jgi:hypothetical protein
MFKKNKLECSPFTYDPTIELNFNLEVTLAYRMKQYFFVPNYQVGCK